MTLNYISFARKNLRLMLGGIPTHDNDRRVLQALYAATGGDQWMRKRCWMSLAPISEWQGVYINSSGRVNELHLINNNLCGMISEAAAVSKDDAGNIPPELSQLSNLQALYLTNDNLSGDRFLTAVLVMI